MAAFGGDFFGPRRIRAGRSPGCVALLGAEEGRRWQREVVQVAGVIIFFAPGQGQVLRTRRPAGLRPRAGCTASRTRGVVGRHEGAWPRTRGGQGGQGRG